MGIETLAAMVANKRGDCHYRVKARFDRCPIMAKEPTWRDCARCEAYIPYQPPKPKPKRAR